MTTPTSHRPLASRLRRLIGATGVACCAAALAASPALADIVRDVRFESADEAYENLLKLYGDEYKDSSP